MWRRLVWYKFIHIIVESAALVVYRHGHLNDKLKSSWSFSFI
jgi:hypothetical protein